MGLVGEKVFANGYVPGKTTEETIVYAAHAHSHTYNTLQNGDCSN